jgi:hypothetical protein
MPPTLRPGGHAAAARALRERRRGADTNGTRTMYRKVLIASTP